MDPEGTGMDRRREDSWQVSSASPTNSTASAAESTGAEAVRRAVSATWRIEAAKIIAVLSRYVGDFGFAEDLAQEALAAALVQWPKSGIPTNPAAWLTTVAKRRAVDSWRRSERFDDRMVKLAGELASDQTEDIDALPWDPDAIDDDVLRLVFISCHPVLGRSAQLALSLRVVGGLSSEQIARAFLIPVSTVQQRIVRAKKTLADADVPFDLPPANQRNDRLRGVLGVLYLMFSEGHVATPGRDWMRPELAMEALRLTRMSAGLLPQEAEVHGLVSLMAFTASRFPARLGRKGEPILLADQDRSKWDRSLIRLGRESLHTARNLRPAVGPYTLQAMVAACHAEAPNVETTNWTRIAQLYADLNRAHPSPITQLNRAIAIAEAQGAAQGLALVDELSSAGALDKFHLVPSVRGELLSRLGRSREACAQFEHAASLTKNDREREVLLAKAKRIQMTPTSPFKDDLPADTGDSCIPSGSDRVDDADLSSDDGGDQSRKGAHTD